ncbi:MAG: OPT family oligopeptide transporter, partial [Planctomycetota bacterium]
MDGTSERERHWYEHIYRRDARQLTLRAVAGGMLVGVVMCLSNRYVFFKTGWSMGVTVTAAILLFAGFRLLAALGATKTPFGALENNVATTVASGAGYMTGGGNMSAFGALLMITTVRPETAAMVLWFAAIAALGVFAAIPIKRQLINVEDLPFPTGTATAITIRSIHGEAGGVAGAREGGQQSRALGLAALVAAVVTLLRDVATVLPGSFKFPFAIAGQEAAKWTLTLKAELVLVGGGVLMSFRTVWSMLLGGLLTYGVLAPELLANGLISEASNKAIVSWTVWPGAAILVASGLTSFALDWRSVARTFAGLTDALRGKRAAPSATDEAAIECPGAWFPLGFALLSPLVVFLMMRLFHIPWWAGLVAIPLSIVMGFVAARVTGETDITPTKAFGPVTQLVYGGLTPGNVAGNIMAANVTAGVGLHAADLLTTIKTGWLLGGNPRAQFFAQLAGVLVGAAVIVPAFNLLIPDPSVLGSEEWPAPACLVWSGVSELFAGGLDRLDPAARSAIGLGLALGVALALLEKFAPKKLKPWVPSPSGLGISMVIPGANSIAMFLGGLAAELWRRKKPELATRFAT